MLTRVRGLLLFRNYVSDPAIRMYFGISMSVLRCQEQRMARPCVSLQTGDRKSNKICGIIERPEHRCGDDLVIIEDNLIHKCIGYDIICLFRSAAYLNSILTAVGWRRRFTAYAELLEIKELHLFSSRLINCLRCHLWLCFYLNTRW